MGAIGEQAAAGATPAVIEGSLDTMAERENRTRLVQILGSPEVEDAARELSARVTDGTLAALTQEQRFERVTAATNAFIAKVSEAMSEQLHETVAPEIARTVAMSTDAAIRRALSGANLEQLGSAIALLAERAVTAILASVRAEIRAMVREELGPALRDELRDPETQRVLGQTARTMSKQVVLGAQEGFETLNAREDAGRARATVLTRLQDMTSRGNSMMTLVVVVLLLLVLVVGGWVARSWLRVRGALATAKTREVALVGELEALRAQRDDAADRRTRDDDEQSGLHRRPSAETNP